MAVRDYPEKAKDLQHPYLIQLGDMFDLWIGLACALDPDSGKIMPAAEPMMDFWLNETRQAVPAALTLERMAGHHGKVTGRLIRGNHDNYLAKRGANPFYLSDEKYGIFAEHGHATDDNNCDKDPRSGWAVTQLAFLDPKLRDYEETLRGQFADFIGIQRMKAMANAVEECWKQKRCIYVMGHTHRSTLKRIRLKPKWCK